MFLEEHIRGNKVPLFAVFLSLSLLLARVSWAQGGGAAGQVSAVTGSATVTRLGAERALVYGAAIYEGDRLATGAHSGVTITLVDGTQLQLGESSTLVVVANSLSAAGVRQHTRVDLLGGLLHSLVRFAPGNAPNYEVHTPNAVAAARGTDYTTDYLKGVARKEHPGCSEFTDVAVYAGLVAVSNPGNPGAGSVLVGPGHRLAVPCSLLSSSMVTTANAGAVGGLTPAGITASGVLGSAVAGAAVVGGIGGAGDLGGGSSPQSPAQ